MTTDVATHTVGGRSATFADPSGHARLAPSGHAGAGRMRPRCFFAGPRTTVPAPMVQGSAGVFGAHQGQRGWVVAFYR